MYAWKVPITKALPVRRAGSNPSFRLARVGDEGFAVRRDGVLALVAPRLTALVLSAAGLCAFGDEPNAGDAPASSKPVTVSEKGTIELHVANRPLGEVLELIAFDTQRNIIASPNVKGSVTAHLYGVTLEQALEAILLQNDAGYRTVGNFIYVHTNAELAQLNAAAGKLPTTKVFRLNYIAAVDAKSYIDPIVGKEGSVIVSPASATGLGSEAEAGGGQSNANSDFIVVTAKVEVLREVERVLKEIDVRPRQVLVEATILRAELRGDNALGIDFSLVGGVDLELLGATSNGIQDITLGALPQNRFEQMNAIATTDLANNVPDGGMTFGIIKDQVAVFLRALEEVTDTTVLANPKVLALNKQKGQVIVGRRDGFLTTTVTETQAVQAVEFLETGTQLIFRPFIADDGFVRIELHPEDSVGFVNAQGLPSEQTTEVTTNVIVRDGETILIGGLFRELTTDSKSQVPGLGSIPGVGQLFRANQDSTGREEVIILLTIHVVKDHAAYAAQSQEQYENIERLRVGMRKGLMWHGRERLAEAHYQKAVAALDAGKQDKALWHAKLATHCFPRHLPAIELKETLLSRREWDSDDSTSRLFIQRLLTEERGETLAPFDRPNPTAKESQP